MNSPVHQSSENLQVSSDREVQDVHDEPMADVNVSNDDVAADNVPHDGLDELVTAEDRAGQGKLLQE